MEDLSTNVWQTIISTLITEGEPAVKTGTDFFFAHKYPLLEDEQHRPALKAQSSSRK